MAVDRRPHPRRGASSRPSAPCARGSLSSGAVGEDEAAGFVNELLREAGALPQLVRHDDYGYHIHATSPHAPLADRMAVEAAMAFTDVIRAEALDRLRICEADGAST